MKAICLKITGCAALLFSFAYAAPAQSWVQWDTASGGNGHWYKAVVNTNALNWPQVDQLARNEGGYLATINSAAENNFVFGLINSPEFFQGNGGNGSGPAIGGYQPDGAPDAATGWSWETGEAWSYTNWAPGQPDSSGETRAEFWSGSQGMPLPTWNNLSPDDNNLGGYVIERDDRPAPAPSGFYGQAYTGASGGGVLRPVLGIPVRTFVSVYNAGGKIVSRIPSNPAGQFYLYLKPGHYTLIATPPKHKFPPHYLSQIGANGVPSSVTVQITVNPHQLTPVEIDY